MSLTVPESGPAAKAAVPSSADPTEANAQPSIIGKPPERVGLGSLGQPGARAVTNAGGGVRVAELPMVRVRAIVRAGERGAIQRMEQRTPARVIVPDLRVPQGSAGGAVLRGVFPPGSVVVRTSASRTPPLQGYQPTGESLVAIEAAFTPQRIDALGALGNEQKLLARSLLADLLPRLQAGTISEAEFKLGVGLVLQAARNYTPPAPAATQPAPVPVIGSTPQGTLAKTPVARGPAVSKEPQGTRAVELTRAEAVATPLRLPPVRPANFDIAKVPAARVLEALNAFESNGYPVSNPTYEAPADALFETAFKGLDRLGSRALTMAEWRAVVTAATSGTSEQSYAGAGARADLRLVVDPAQSMSPHEFHLAGGGFGDVPRATGRVINAGLGREGGLVAHLTDEFNQDAPQNYGDAREIFAFWGKDIAQSRSANAYVAAPDWDAQTKALATGSASVDLPVHLKSFWGRGYFADPREMAVLRPVIKELLGSAPDSPQRVRAATALVTHLRERAKLTERVSVSGATAEIQFTQTLYRYFKENGINPYDPKHKIDFVDVQKLYHRLLDQGALETRADVTSFLTGQNVPFYP